MPGGSEEREGPTGPSGTGAPGATPDGPVGDAGWWMAADGGWRPSHLHPTHQARAQAVASGWGLPSDGAALHGPAGPSAPRRSRRRRATAAVAAALLGAAGLLAAGALVGAGSHKLAARRASSVPSSAPAAPPRPAGSQPPAGPRPPAGHVLFADTFRGPQSGWFIGAFASGGRAAYDAGGYVVTAAKPDSYWVYAPYVDPFGALAVSATAEPSTGSLAGAPLGAGLGVGCDDGVEGPAAIGYAFLVRSPGFWLLERTTGARTADRQPVVYAAGALPAAADRGAVTVEGVCDIAPGRDRLTRLQMFVDGQRVAAISDRSPEPLGPGWVTSLWAIGPQGATSTVTARRFDVQELSP